MSKQTIWSYLKTHTDLPDVSIAGIMGNMEAESNCESCRVQGDFSVDRTTSKAYAEMVNNGSYNWSRDARGWGLCQWTYWTRKDNLLNSCRSQGKGVEDETAQLTFMLAEMQTEYVAMWNRLHTCTTIADAAGLVCREYERPAVLNITERTKYGQQIYEQFHSEIPSVDTDYCNDKVIALLEEAIKILKGE